MNIVLNIVFTLGVFVFFFGSFAFIRYIRKYQKNPHLYDTRFCKDIRANLDMFAYKTKVEANRKKLKGKFKI